MHSDSYFYIGKTHKICQDFCINGTNNATNLPFAVLSDGCSSSPLTDLGARLLCLKTAEFLGSDCSHKVMPDWVIRSLAASVRSIPAPEESLDATIMYVQALPGNKYTVYCKGDGVIAKVLYDGTIEATEIQYSSGAPLYMSYELSPARYADYVKLFGEKRIINHYRIYTDKCPEVFSIEQDEDSGPYIEFERASNNYKVIAVMSDGVMSFTKIAQNESSKVRDTVPLADVLKDMLNFKTFGGEFVVRRLERFKKEFESTNEDDVSMGAVFFG